MIDADERETLRDVARRLLEKESSPARVRARTEEPAAYDPDLWRAMSDLGWFGLDIPEEMGGAGHSFAELSVILEELGRHITPGPFFSTVVLGAGALMSSGSELHRDLLSGIATGETRVALAISPPTGGTGKRVALRADGKALRLEGVAEFVLDAHTAETLIVSGDEGGEAMSLFVVPASSGGVTVDVLPTIDVTRRLCHVTLDLAVDEQALVGKRGAARSILDRVIDRAAAALAADSVGGAQRVLEMCVDYAKQRVQFGRPIGSFQAIKHRCADMLLLVETSKVAAERAAEEISRPGGPSEAAAIAKAYACDAYAKIGGDGIQTHGGIGFTWEHDIHLYFKRAKLNQALFGDSAWHRARLASMVLPK